MTKSVAHFHEFLNCEKELHLSDFTLFLISLNHSKFRQKDDRSSIMTRSCPLLRYFGTLFWDDITIFCYENQVNKLLIGPEQGFSQFAS